MKAKLPFAILLSGVLTAAATLSLPARADRDDHHRGYERHHHGYERHHRGGERHARGDRHYRDFDGGHQRRYTRVDTRYVPAWRVQRFYHYAYGPHWAPRAHYYRHAGPGWYYSGAQLVIDNRSADVVRAAIAAGLIVDIINHH